MHAAIAPVHRFTVAADDGNDFDNGMNAALLPNVNWTHNSRMPHFLKKSTCYRESPKK